MSAAGDGGPDALEPGRQPGMRLGRHLARSLTGRHPGRRLAALLTVLAVVGAALGVPEPGHGAATASDHLSARSGTFPTGALPTSPVDVALCPWLQSAMSRHDSPAVLASATLSRMTLAEKLGELVLTSSGAYENFDAGVGRLCIPSLTLQDGPQGLAFGDTNVTQLPAPLGIAATFDPSIARTYGEVQGSEARGQGIDVVQGPNLNIDRVPQNGRAYEGYGEDPTLVSAMGVADIRGIQSRGVLAQAKHLVAYNQEADRSILDTSVSNRVLHEVYLPPFEAAVHQGHVGSIMCAYPQLNGTFQCQDPHLQSLLAAWGFTGFVRSDLGAVHDPVAALSAGTDLLKPASVPVLAADVRSGALPVSVVDADVQRLLAVMFAAGFVGRVSTGTPGTPVDSASHAAFALRAAERSAVLLRNRGGLLPLHAGRLKDVAVIGAAGGTAPATTGFGSSKVVAPFTSSPLAALEHQAGPGVSFAYEDGGSTTKRLPTIPTSYLTPEHGTGHGLTFTVSPGPTSSGAGGLPIQTVDPLASASLGVSRSPAPARQGATPVLPERPGRSLHHPVPPDSTATQLMLPADWTDVTATWTGTLTPPRTGLYSLSLSGSGGATLTLDGATAVSNPISHVGGTWSSAVRLTGGHRYRLALSWRPQASRSGTGQGTLVPSRLSLGWQYDSDAIAGAVAAARSAQVAVVFASDVSAEGFDRPTLALPGDQDALIAAVAAANPRTVVVLDTGGPVLMPWLHEVAGVMEAWYPGEQDGAAIAALLFGAADPSGRLPVTFPATGAQSAIHTAAQWPGIDLVSTYSEGLEVGYRYDNATGIRPMFPFGFGLAYTSFSLHGLTSRHAAGGTTLTVSVTNSGRRRGRAVPEAYLTYPAAAGEPPGKLVSFASVALDPGQTRAVSLTVPSSAFRSYQHGSWTTVAGDYTLAVGTSSSDLPLRVTVPVA